MDAAPLSRVPDCRAVGITGTAAGSSTSHFLIDSFGLVDPPSSHRWTCCMLAASLATRLANLDIEDGSSADDVDPWVEPTVRSSIV
jgi:hypothetical protein